MRSNGSTLMICRKAQIISAEFFNLQISICMNIITVQTYTVYLVIDMYLINYDYFDLHALITFFRNEPERFVIYKSAMQEIISYLKAPVQNSLNCNTIRNIVKPYYDESDKAIAWVLVNNEYTANISVVKNMFAYEIISAILCEMTVCYDDLERFYLLCDAAHNIPLILVNENKPKNAINFMIKDYRKRYNSFFLKDELKGL